MFLLIFLSFCCSFSSPVLLVPLLSISHTPLTNHISFNLSPFSSISHILFFLLSTFSYIIQYFISHPHFSPPPPSPSYLLQPAFTSIDTELYSLQSIIFPFVFICFHCLRNTKKFAKFHNFLVTWLKILVTKAALYYQLYSKFYIDFKRGFFSNINFTNQEEFLRKRTCHSLMT